MEVRYQLKDEKEESVERVDFVNFYPANETIFVRYCREKKPCELMLNATKMIYFKVYRD